jgi:mannosyl-oligosaccharide glucosidase
MNKKLEKTKLIFEQPLSRFQELWSPYGLRSLAANCPYYDKYNTRDDPPYWRGDIWVNINYLALDALQHYSQLGGPNAERAGKLYKSLKKNLVDNIVKQFHDTGYFWEHYSDRTGKGLGTRPFTGWTSLVFAIITDNYD